MTMRHTIMELAPSWVSYAVAWVATLSLLLLSRRHLLRRKLNLPPGPKPWPLIGNLNLMTSLLPHKSIHQLSIKYGPIMHLRFGSCPVVVGSSVEMAKLFLQTHDTIFQSRPKTAAGKYLMYNNSNIMWNSDESYFRQVRKICLLELFSTKQLNSSEYVRNEERNALLKAICKSSGKTIQLKDYLSTLSLNVISRMVMGKKYIVESEDAILRLDEFKKMLDEFFWLTGGALNIGDLIPWMDFLDMQGYVKRMKALNKKFDRFLEHVLEGHHERRKGAGNYYVAKDLLDVLLHMADDPNCPIKFGSHGIKAIVLDLILGGTQSSTLTIEWAMSELLKKPEILNKAIEELDKVIGEGRWVEEKDFVNLPYIDAITKETMRLHPISPLLSPRLCREDCQIAGYDITKGTQVMVNVWTIGRDATIWKNPDEFHPERFFGQNIDVKGQFFELLPFGSGRRMCPAYNLGLKIVQTNLANLLHGFSWKLAGDLKKEDLNMEELVDVSNYKKFPLHVVVEPRLPPHLYS